MYIIRSPHSRSTVQHRQSNNNYENLYLENSTEEIYSLHKGFI